MKRLALLLFLVYIFMQGSAQLAADGYYRVKNYGSQRYIYVCDGTSSGINAATTSADMGAVQTWKELNKALTDPASIIYMEKHDDKWDLLAQGTGVYDLIKYYVGINELSRSNNIYQVSATASGMTLFLYDTETSGVERGRLGTGSSTNSTVPAKYNRWQIYGINNSDNYVAVNPGKLNVGGKYYAPYYASYPFSFHSSGMKAYYVKKIDTVHNIAVITAIQGIIPSSTPVIIECSSNSIPANKLQLESYRSHSNRPVDNLLDGVYFSNKYRVSPIAYREYNRETMRVLGKTKSGKLGFITATTDMLNNCGYGSKNILALPANQSYLPVPAGTADELAIMTEAEYESEFGGMITDLSLSNKELSLTIGESHSISTVITPADAKNPTLVWSSTAPETVSVNNGVITAHNVGVATITATTTDGSNITASCVVTVNPVLTENIVLSSESLDVEEGEQFTLTASVVPDNATNKSVVWSSTNADVAHVDAQGNVSAKAAGNAKITATAADGSGVSASCEVNVRKKVILATRITVEPNTVSLFKGTSVQLKAVVYPEEATTKTVRWESSDNEIATVTTDGLVNTFAGGQVTITAHTTDGSHLSSECIVIVNVVNGVASIHVSDYPIGTKFFTLSGQLLPSPHKGIVVVRYSDGTVRTLNIK